MPKVTATIITLDEEAHIEAAIRSVDWADEIVVVDAGSNDDTIRLAEAAGARIATRAWTGWIDQKNYAAQLASHDWILSLDADERVSPELAAELRALLAAEPALGGYRMPRVSFHLGRWIRTTDFYPDYQTRLYDRRRARWRGHYVHESVAVDGPVGTLTHELQHFSFESLADHLARLNHYSTLAARQMYDSGRRTSAVMLIVHPAAAFLRNYILRKGILDGATGLALSAVNACGVFMKLVKLWERQRLVDRGAAADDAGGR